MADIFISYAREDKARVKPLVDALEQQGWSVFWDRRIRAGQKFSIVIENELQNARCAIVVWSEHSLDSDWVHDEATEAKGREIILPVILDAIKPPMGFRRIHAADLSSLGRGKHDDVLDRLFEDIRDILGDPIPIRGDDRSVRQKSTNKQIDSVNVDINISTYETVKIGNQVWMAENLNVSHYRNGDSIPQVQDADKWVKLNTGAWCYYKNNNGNDQVYGKLYNWFTVNDTRGLAPEGWHIPTDKEWQELECFLGMSLKDAKKTSWRGSIGGKLKETGTAHWSTPNAGVTNESGFTALAGGYRSVSGGFGGIGHVASFWSSSADYDENAWFRFLGCSETVVYRNGTNKRFGMSVRCVRDY